MTTALGRWIKITTACRCAQIDRHLYFDFLGVLIEPAVSLAFLHIRQHLFPVPGNKPFSDWPMNSGRLLSASHEPLIAQDRHGAFAAIQVCGHLLAEFLDNRDIEVSPTTPSEFAIGSDRYR